MKKILCFLLVSFFLVGCFGKTQETPATEDDSSTSEQQQVTPWDNTSDTQTPQTSVEENTSLPQEVPVENESTSSPSTWEESSDNNTEEAPASESTQDETITETPEELVDDFDAEIESLFDLFEEDE